jgi:FAD dependent oxidoreductase TIGR03364
MTWQGKNGRSRVVSRKAKLRIAVIGGGIVGLAHAWAAAKRGHQVHLFERHAQARGASIRNFGMVWPIGQPNGPLHRAALRSRELWKELLTAARLWHRETGSIHLAFERDEFAVLEEFARLGPTLGYDCQLLSRQEVLRRSAAVRREGLLGGLWSQSELCVDPREVISKLPLWLAEKYRITSHFGTAIEHVSLPSVVDSNGSRWQVDRVIIATGADLQSLFPQVLSRAGFRKCKLQMMRTVPQPNGWQLGPMLASGLTLRHYESFRVCHSLQALKDRISRTAPELDRFGIHVMAAQNGLGEVVLGDSHEYEPHDVSPFDNPRIDELILAELQKRIDLPDWTIQQRWHGVYAKLPGTVQYENEIEPGVHAVIASGGCGMTMSFGLAEQLWEGRYGSIASNGADHRNESAVDVAPVVVDCPEINEVA